MPEYTLPIKLERAVTIDELDLQNRFRVILDGSPILAESNGRYLAEKVLEIPTFGPIIKYVRGLVVYLRDAFEIFLDESYHFESKTMDRVSVQDVFTFDHDVVRKRLYSYLQKHNAKSQIDFGIFLAQNKDKQLFLTLGSELREIQQALQLDPGPWADMLTRYNIDKMICKNLNIGQQYEKYFIDQNVMKKIRLDSMILSIAKKYKLTNTEYLYFSSLVHAQEDGKEKMEFKIESFDSLLRKVLERRKEI